MPRRSPGTVASRRAAASLLAAAILSCGGPATRPAPGPTVCAEAGRARALAAEGRLHAALAAAERAERGCPSPASARLRAEALADLGLDGEAIAAWRLVVDRGGDRRTAAAAIAELGRRPPARLPEGQGDRDRALALYRDGVGLRLTGKPDAAIRALRRSYAAWPHPLTIVQIALAHRGAGRAVDARKAAARALALAEHTRGARATARVRSGHAAPVLGIAFSPDGRLMASAGADHAVLLWDAATGRELRRFDGHRDAVKAVAFSPDGRHLATAGMDRAIRLWDVATGTLERVLHGHDEAIESLAFSPDGGRLASAGWDGMVRVWDLANGAHLHALAHQGMATGVAFSPDGARLASGGMGDGIRLWDLESGAPLAALGGQTMVNDLAFTRDGRRLLVGAADGLQLWDLAAGRTLWSRPLEQAPDPAVGGAAEPVAVEAVAFSPDGAQLAVSGGLVVSLRDTATGAELRRFTGHGGQVFAVAFRDAEVLASGSLDDTIRLWRIDSGEAVRTLRFHGEHTDEAAFDPAGPRLAMLRGGELVVRDLGPAGGTDRFPIDPDGGELSLNAAPLAFSADGARLVYASASGEIRVRHGGRSTLLGHPAASRMATIHAFAFSPDGGLVASAGTAGAHLWPAGGGAPARALGGEEATAVAFSADGTLLAAAFAAEVRVWRVRSGAERARLAIPAARVLALSADGAQLAAAGERTITIAALAGGAPRIIDKAHAGAVTHLVFGAGGLLASGGADGKIKLWRPGQAEPLRTIVAGRSALIDVGWRGAVLWAIDRDGEVTLWAAASGAARGEVIASGDDDWLVIAADARVDGSMGEAELDQLLYWQVDDLQLPAFVGWERQHAAGLLIELLGGASGKLRP